MIRLLTERLEPFGVKVETRRSVWVNGRWRPQFSLKWMFVATAVAALLLGLWLYVHPRPQGPDLAFAVFLPMFLGIPWIVLLFVHARHWPAFLFGYWCGFQLERWAFLGLQIQSFGFMSTPSWTWQGWYPFAVPQHRFLVLTCGMASEDALLYAWLVGCVVSSVVMAFAALGLEFAVRAAMKRIRGKETESISVAESRSLSP